MPRCHRAAFRISIRSLNPIQHLGVAQHRKQKLLPGQWSVQRLEKLPEVFALRLQCGRFEGQTQQFIERLDDCGFQLPGRRRLARVQRRCEVFERWQPVDLPDDLSAECCAVTQMMFVFRAADPMKRGVVGEIPLPSQIPWRFELRATREDFERIAFIQPGEELPVAFGRQPPDPAGRAGFAHRLAGEERVVINPIPSARKQFLEFVKLHPRRFQVRLDRSDRELPIRRRRLLLVGRRHLAMIQLLVNLLPCLDVPGSFRLDGQRRQRDLAFRVFLAVAVDAVRIEERAHCFRVAHRLGSRDGRDHQQRQAESYDCGLHGGGVPKFTSPSRQRGTAS